MLSLDKKIFDPTSAVAKRMIEYGEKGRLTIVVPAEERCILELSSDVIVYGSGGKSKLTRLFKSYAVAKKVVSQHRHDRITTQDPFFTGFLGIRLKRRFHFPLEVQLHGDFFSSDYYRRGSISNRIRYLLARYYVLPRADRVRVVGERVKQSILALGISESKIDVRPVPFDHDALRAYVSRFHLHERFPGFGKIFLVLGRLDPVKNIPWLLDLFPAIVKEQPKTLLLIVGDGIEQKRIKERISTLDLANNVRLEGWTADPWSYIKTADALLFPSLSEGYGLVVMEAVAVGTPVIMTDVGVANYEVKAGENMTIVPINDKEKFIHTMLQLL